LALVALSVVEQRFDAVRAVLSGATVTEVAAAMGVSRQRSWAVRRSVWGVAPVCGSRGLGHLCPRGGRPAGWKSGVAAGVHPQATAIRSVSASV
jgi:hypothetical protein